MTTKTFSGRADADLLALADALAQREYGMSYGQYCASVLLESVCSKQELPRLEAEKKKLQQKEAAIKTIRSFALLPHNPEIGRMTDDELKDLIASRYE